MTAWAWYNEIDEYAAEWLRNLIAAGHIAPGVVDTRSIEDVRPDDLREFAQCHFFAGIGVWSHALRRIGWPDDRRIWTGSCPCQPFSAAGKGGGFNDQRHLWPAWFHLITQCSPQSICGEQVASGDGLGWLDLVHADLEAAGYACGAVDLCAAGVGAPHIRQRLWIYADRLADNNNRRFDPHAFRQFHDTEYHVESRGSTCRLDDDDDARLEGFGRRYPAQIGRFRPLRPVATAGESGGVADDLLQQRSDREPGISTEHDQGGRIEDTAAIAGLCGNRHTGPTNRLWRDADWLFCRDGKWRPVEPGTFPLAHGAAARVGRLRAYGNAICAEAAVAFLDATVNKPIE